MNRRNLFAGAVVLAVGLGAGYLVAKRAAGPSALRDGEIADSLARIDEKLERMDGARSLLEARVAALRVAVETQLRAGETKSPRLPSGEMAGSDQAAIPGRGEPHPRSAEALAAQGRAEKIVAEAKQAGRWTDAERDRLREAFATADDDARLAILRDLSVAFNSGKLALESHGPPF